jgi:hypothetical protein
MNLQPGVIVAHTTGPTIVADYYGETLADGRRAAA